MLGRLADADGTADAAVGTPGATVRATDGAVTRGPDRPRLADLGEVPSPYRDGPLGAAPAGAWPIASLETNRGCPYGCTFCDWGQDTMSRIRKFPMERVLADIEEIGRLEIPFVFVTDANFGIMRRDVEIAEALADVHDRTGWPRIVNATFTKNTNKYVIEIVRTWVAAGIQTEGVLSLQTEDAETLHIIGRDNIKTSRFDELLGEFQRQGLPVTTELIMGLPGSTLETFGRDLRRSWDRGVLARVYPAYLLPNSPMNEPAYRAAHGIETAADGLTVQRTTSFSRDDWHEMRQLAFWWQALVNLGLLRQTLRFLEADHALDVVDVIHEIERAAGEEPARFPLLAFCGRFIDRFTVPPGGWPPLYDELR
ncbi:MAG: radical SAM protein, partial [Actinomycetota bacterium]